MATATVAIGTPTSAVGTYGLKMRTTALSSPGSAAAMPIAAAESAVNWSDAPREPTTRRAARAGAATTATRHASVSAAPLYGSAIRRSSCGVGSDIAMHAASYAPAAASGVIHDSRRGTTRPMSRPANIPGTAASAEARSTDAVVNPSMSGGSGAHANGSTATGAMTLTATESASIATTVKARMPPYAYASAPAAADPNSVV